MTSVRFLYTSQPGTGFEEFTNPDYQLKNWLRDGLRQPNSGNIRYFNNGLGITVQDDLVICTYLSREADDNKRPFARNHSVLFSTESEYNKLAGDFNNSILAQIEEGDREVIEDGHLKRFSLPIGQTNGLSKEELEVLASYRAWDIKKLMASLIDGKAFSIYVKGTAEESTALVITLLKIAALGNLPVPQISTFEPNGKTRSWYPSQVLPSPNARLDIQFQQKEAPGKEANEQAVRLARAVENRDPDGIIQAMRIGRDHSWLKAERSLGQEVQVPASEPRRPESPKPARSGRKRADVMDLRDEGSVYEDNKEYEKYLEERAERQKDDLNRKGQELDDRERDLNERQEIIDAREEALKQEEKKASEATARAEQEKAKRQQWRHIDAIFLTLDKENCQVPEERVLSRFFDELKNLDQDKLQALNDGVNSFLPGLDKIAELIEPKKAIFLKDVEDIKKKLEGNKSRLWRF